MHSAPSSTGSFVPPSWQVRMQLLPSSGQLPRHRRSCARCRQRGNLAAPRAETQSSTLAATKAVPSSFLYFFRRRHQRLFFTAASLSPANISDLRENDVNSPEQPPRLNASSTLFSPRFSEELQYSSHFELSRPWNSVIFRTKCPLPAVGVLSLVMLFSHGSRLAAQDLQIFGLPQPTRLSRRSGRAGAID